jgi:hypothetical protein
LQHHQLDVENCGGGPEKSKAQVRGLSSKFKCAGEYLDSPALALASADAGPCPDIEMFYPLLPI